jgi:hypothetical protein
MHNAILPCQSFRKYLGGPSGYLGGIFPPDPTSELKGLVMKIAGSVLGFLGISAVYWRLLAPAIFSPGSAHGF